MGLIVWLASYPKSGNTWVRAFLHNYILQPPAPYSINDLDRLSASECAAAFFRPYDPRPAAAYTEAEVQRMRPAVHRDLTRLHDDLVFIKTHNAARALHGVALCTWTLTAGAIYLARDPRDVAVSYARYTGRSLDDIIAFMGNAGASHRGTDAQVFERLGSWSGHAESWLARPKTLVLRYEDLSTAPERAFGKIVGFLGDGVAELERLRRAVAYSDFKTLAQQELHGGYVAKSPATGAAFFREGRIGQWRQHLTAAQASRIEADHSAMMQKFGYLS